MSQPELRVDFYIIADASMSTRLRIACRLTDKAFSLNNRVHAHVENAAEARELDELMWTFRQGSFIPHKVLGSSADEPAPVTIGYGDQYEAGGDLLINLCGEIPNFFDEFGRVAEIVDGDEEQRRLGRERFGFYRDNGYTQNTHKLEQ